MVKQEEDKILIKITRIPVGLTVLCFTCILLYYSKAELSISWQNRKLCLILEDMAQMSNAEKISGKKKYLQHKIYVNVS